jgi:hypothetical protein
METSGIPEVNPIASPAYSRYLAPARSGGETRDAETGTVEALDAYYHNYDDRGLPGQRIDLFA